MKIHFTYRSGYVPNNRYSKTFEANSVLDWFVQNWDKLTDEDEYKTLLGTSVYGFPFSDYKSENPIAPPRNLKELKEKIESHVYSNEVFVKQDCVQVHTDDDEIELAWHVFDEKYAEANREKTKLWFLDNLPAAFGKTPYTEKIKGTSSKAKGDENARTYYLSTCIYDSCNFDSLSTAHIFKGVSLPNLVGFLRGNQTATTGKETTADYEIEFIQNLARKYPSLSPEEFFGALTRYNLADPPSEDEISLPDDAPNEKSALRYSEHLIEMMIEKSGFYDYIVLFDDYWLNENTELGLSLVHFHKDWKV